MKTKTRDCPYGKLINDLNPFRISIALYSRYIAASVKNQRHNITEDNTWQQVLAFSGCVHENLEGYDSEGTKSILDFSLKQVLGPVLIDEFVEHVYRFGTKT
ncbi:hypothetical protein YC2023_019826 [Brassica napus]